jgi:ParB family chromosome partitioning protein
MAKQTKPRLGRGLSSLINTPVTVPAEDTKQNPIKQSPSQDKDIGSGLQMLPLSSIRPGPFQPRADAASSDLEPLAASIRSSGVIQPIAVRPSGEGVWELIAGERRWRAASLAGLERIPALVVDADDRQAAEWGLIENVQREDLSPIERGEALKNLASTFGASHTDLGERVGLDRSTVSNLIRLTELEPRIRELLGEGVLGAGHGKALLALPSGATRVKLAERAAKEQWSVRRLESVEGASSGSGASRKRSQADPQIADLERQIGEHLGTRVRVQTDAKRSRGRLVIDFYDAEHFDGLVRAIGVRLES